MIHDLAVVTGAASGIGNAVATLLAGEGMKVVLADIDAEALDAAVQKLRGQRRPRRRLESRVGRGALPPGPRRLRQGPRALVPSV